jgi:spore coat protein H
MPKSRSLVSLRLAGLAVTLVLVGCRADPAGPEAPAGPDAAPERYNPDWTMASHSNDAQPNYGVVFPQATVNRIDLTMTAAQWTAIRANMRSLWGSDFGVPGGGGAPGGFPSTEPDYQSISFRFNGRQWKDVGFRLKGNSSLGGAWRAGNYKLPFRLQFDEFEDSIPAIKNQRFHGFKELSMSPAWSDPSLIREKVTADLFRLAGIPAAQTAFYRVFIDFGEGPKYCGVYTMVEVIDDTMLAAQYGEERGNIYKPESNFVTFAESQFEKKNNQGTRDWRDVQSTVIALNSPLRATNPAAWRSGLEAVFNVEHFLKWLAVNNAIVNWDTYGAIAHNYYLYNHSSRRLLWIPWDHNMSMSGNPGVTGTPGPGGPMAPGGRIGLSLSMNEVGNGWPLLRFLIDDPIYRERYRAHMRTFRDNVFSEAEIGARFEQAHTLIAPWVIGTDGEQPRHTHLASPAQFTAALPALKAHIAARRTVIAAYLQ